MVNTDLDELGVHVLELSDKLDTNHTTRLLESDLVELGSPDEPEVAVGITDLQPKQSGYAPVIHASDDSPHEVVRTRELVALDNIDVVVDLIEQLLEFTRVVLTVTIGVEHPVTGCLRKT